MRDKKLGLGALTCLVIGTMIGSGAFALPQNLAAGAGALAIMLGWLITGAGMIALARVFGYLNEAKPDLQSGIYTYAREGFGEFVGFNSAWGYWLSALLGNVSYAVLMFSALGYFFPVFGKGNTPAAILGASLFLWLIHFLILKGMKEAALVNVLATLGKIIPILVFLIFCLLTLNFHRFHFDFTHPELGSVFTQLKTTMLVTLWAFIGVEGAVVLSGRAKKHTDVGKATLIGLVSTLILYILISLLSLFAVGQPALAKMPDPSMAYVLKSLVGPWGATLINIGLVISLVGAWLGWTLLCAELPYIAAKDHVLPKVFGLENKNGSPSGALWITNCLIQFFLIVVLFSQSTYLTLLKLATSCILMPYLFSAFYGLKLATTIASLRRYIFISSLASLYAIWLIYAAGLNYLLASSLLYGVGVFVFIWAKKQAREIIFQGHELVGAVALLMVSAAALLAFCTHRLT